VCDGFCENPLFHCFVAEVRKRNCGHGICIIIDIPLGKEKPFILEDLIVKEKMRGSGLDLPCIQKLLNKEKQTMSAE
jgi:hypothetical protein